MSEESESALTTHDTINELMIPEDKIAEKVKNVLEPDCNLIELPASSMEVVMVSNREGYFLMQIPSAHCLSPDSKMFKEIHGRFLKIPECLEMEFDRYHDTLRDCACL